MKFFLIIGANALYTYENIGQKYELQFIEGGESYPYHPSAAHDNVQAYLEALANEKNLGTTAKLEFDVLDCADEYCNTAVFGMLKEGEYIDRHYLIDEAISDVMKKLSRDKKLLIDKYGINYDGVSYKLKNKTLEKGAFDLLAYTIHSDDVISLMNM